MSWVTNLYQALGKTRHCFVKGLGALFSQKNCLTEADEKKLFELMIQADMGVPVTNHVINTLKNQLHSSDAAPLEVLKSILYKLLIAAPEYECNLSPLKSQVILLIGVNGSGKTTTIGKLAHRFRHAGATPLIAAGDTFRAAAIEQLKAWADRSQVPIVAQKIGSDPAAVLFDALQSAQSHAHTLLLADTAGRLQQPSLAEELKKIVRVLKKLDPEAPHEKWLVLDSTLGQNNYSQLHWFHEAIGVTGLIMTKLDGSAKGGSLFGLQAAIPVPIRYLGFGEAVEDLQPFEPKAFVDSLFDRNQTSL